MTDEKDTAGDASNGDAREDQAKVIVIGGNQTVTETLLLLLESGEVEIDNVQLLIEAGDDLEMTVLAGFSTVLGDLPKLDDVPVIFRVDTAVETTSSPLPPYKHFVKGANYLKRQDRFPRTGGNGWQNRKRRK